MMFTGSDEPLVYLELKSIGLPENKTADFPVALSGLLELLADSVYIEFADAPRSMWGWNSAIF